MPRPEVINIEQAKAEEAIRNANVLPYYDLYYKCNSCGNLGRCHPETAMCFDCGADNWVKTTFAEYKSLKELFNMQGDELRQTDVNRFFYSEEFRLKQSGFFVRKKEG